MSDDGVVAEKRNRGRLAKAVDVSDKEVKDNKKRGRPSKSDLPAKSTEKKVVSENGEPAAKRGRGRPKKSAGTKSKPKAVASGKGRGRPASKKAEKEESADENDEAEDED